MVCHVDPKTEGKIVGAASRIKRHIDKSRSRKRSVNSQSRQKSSISEILPKSPGYGWKSPRKSTENSAKAMGEELRGSYNAKNTKSLPDISTIHMRVKHGNWFKETWAKFRKRYRNLY